MKLIKPMLLLLILLISSNRIRASAAINDTKQAAEKCHPHDKRALLRIKQQSFNNSVLFSDWDPSTDCCNGWSLVRCDATSNRVISLTILDSDTMGTPFPSALGDLPYLEDVTFHNNATGPIPASLSKLRRLISLTLSFNLLSGPIPSFFSGFPDLYYLDLSNNLLSGSIPPALALAPSLTNLNLARNRLSGPIPESLGLLEKNQINIDLSHNKLTGEIPTSFRKVKFLSLDVSWNKLKGDASFLFGKDKTVWTLTLSGNSFAFNMTELEFPPMINWLDLSNNRIYGSLSKRLAHLPSLAYFNVSYNRLCGRIPTGGTLSRFQRASYDHNKCLCGTPLPPC